VSPLPLESEKMGKSRAVLAVLALFTISLLVPLATANTDNSDHIIDNLIARNAELSARVGELEQNVKQQNSTIDALRDTTVKIYAGIAVLAILLVGMYLQKLDVVKRLPLPKSLRRFRKTEEEKKPEEMIEESQEKIEEV